MPDLDTDTQLESEPETPPESGKGENSDTMRRIGARLLLKEIGFDDNEAKDIVTLASAEQLVEIGELMPKLQAKQADLSELKQHGHDVNLLVARMQALSKVPTENIAPPPETRKYGRGLEPTINLMRAGVSIVLKQIGFTQEKIDAMLAGRSKEDMDKIEEFISYLSAQGYLSEEIYDIYNNSNGNLDVFENTFLDLQSKIETFGVSPKILEKVKTGLSGALGQTFAQEKNIGDSNTKAFSLAPKVAVTLKSVKSAEGVVDAEAQNRHVENIIGLLSGNNREKIFNQLLINSESHLIIKTRKVNEEDRTTATVMAADVLLAALGSVRAQDIEGITVDDLLRNTSTYFQKVLTTSGGAEELMKKISEQGKNIDIGLGYVLDTISQEEASRLLFAS